MGHSVETKFAWYYFAAHM